MVSGIMAGFAVLAHLGAYRDGFLVLAYTTISISFAAWVALLWWFEEDDFDFLNSALLFLAFSIIWFAFVFFMLALRVLLDWLFD